MESYEVLEVDGEVPRVGILTLIGDTLRLASADTVELSNPPKELRDKAGAKVWIVGSPTGQKLSVQSYGILREAGR